LKHFVLHVLLLLGFSVLGFSQEYPVKFLDISNGLSNNSVTTIFQDNDGYMWFGTYDGLNRYDGYNFKVYRNRINDKNRCHSTLFIILKAIQKRTFGLEDQMEFLFIIKQRQYFIL